MQLLLLLFIINCENKKYKRARGSSRGRYRNKSTTEKLLSRALMIFSTPEEMISAEDLL